MAFSIIDDIRSKELSFQQVSALVKSKLVGTKHRERSSQQTLNLGSYKGVVKVFAKRGQIDVSLKGLPEARLNDLNRQLVATIEAFVESLAAEEKSG